jgi:hypothetical protein
MDHVEIAPVAPRGSPETRQIVTPSAPLDRRPVITEAYGSIVRIFPDGSVIVEVSGDATVTTRVGQLGQTLPLGRTQVGVRVDPPAPQASNSRPTEVGLQTSVLRRE